MKVFYSPSENSFYQSESALGDWVNVPIIPFSDTPYVVVSSQEIDDGNGNMVLKYFFAVDEGSKFAAEQARLALQNALNDYMNLNTAITVDAAQVAGTTNQISALVDIVTYQRMSNKPELFDQEGIVAKKAIGPFQQGQVLLNELEVKQYADYMLAEIDSFLIRRMKAITAYILS